MFLIHPFKVHFKEAKQMMNVPFIDLKLRYEEEKEEILRCIDNVLSKGHLILTEEVELFEIEAAKYIGAKHVVSLNSGTDALMLGLWALGIKKSDEVITTPVSFVASTGAIAHIGAKPVYVDVCNDQNIDCSQIESVISSATKAIMPVHWSGRVANMEKINEIAKKHGLFVIEDAAQAMGAYLNNKHAGTFGDVAAYSAHPLKNLSALGDAGFLATNHDDIAKKVKLYRNHGLESRDNCVMYGVNSRLDSLHAEILRLRLKKLKNIIERRRKNVDIYKKNIKATELYIPEEKTNENNSYVMFIIQAENRDELKKYLSNHNIESLVYYGTPLHLQAAAKNYGYKKGDFPVAESQCDKVLALPHHQNLTEEQIYYVCEVVNKFYGLN
jgi:dTDP-4-amino-4,6-dideoxygalactose transaminase